MRRFTFAAAIVSVAALGLAGTASAGDWTLSLTASPNPVVAGASVTFSGTLLNPSATQGVPNKPVVIRAYGQDATCSGTYAEIGPTLTLNKSGENTKGYYTITDTVPANAHDGTTYYVKAFSTFDDLTVESGCLAVHVTHADAWSIDLSIAPSKVVGSEPVTFSGTLSNLGPTSEVGQPVTINAYWTNSACTGTPSYYFYGTTGAGGAYSIGPIPTGAPAGDYYYTASSNGAVSACRHFTIGWDAGGTVDSAGTSGTTVNLPVAGQYRIDVTGTWDNGPWWGVDADYVQQCPSGGGLWDGVATDGWCPGSELPTAWLATWPSYVNFGNLMINGAYTDWGAYDSGHAYSHTGSYSGSVNLTVFDSGYTDNVGLLNYTITYLGP